jgi:hypothetical protein
MTVPTHRRLILTERQHWLLKHLLGGLLKANLVGEPTRKLLATIRCAKRITFSNEGAPT